MVHCLEVIKSLNDAAVASQNGKRTLDCSVQYQFAESISPRRLDQLVVEHILNWKWMEVHADAKGQNACRILTPDGQLPTGVSLPLLGGLEPYWLAPLFTERLDNALWLARLVKVDKIIVDVFQPADRIAESIVTAILVSKNILVGTKL